MIVADWRHFDDTSLDELDAIILAENAVLNKLVVVVYGQQAVMGGDRHRIGLRQPDSVRTSAISVQPPCYPRISSTVNVMCENASGLIDSPRVRLTTLP